MLLFKPVPPVAIEVGLPSHEVPLYFLPSIVVLSIQTAYIFPEPKETIVPYLFEFAEVSSTVDPGQAEVSLALVDFLALK